MPEKPTYEELEKRVSALERTEFERERELKALRESNGRFLYLASNIPAYLAYVNADTLEYEFVNSAFEKSFGIPREKIIGSHVKDVIGEANYQFALKYIKEVKSGKSISYENTFDLASGRRWIQVNYAPITNSGGRITSIAVLSYDITELKRAEEALQKSYGHISSILESISDAFFSINDDMTVTYFNQAAERLLCKQKEEVLGRNLFDVFPEARGSIFEERYRQAIREKRSLSFETYFEVEPYINWFDVRVYPQENGISVYFQVTTERRLAERALQSSEDYRKRIFESSRIPMVVLDVDTLRFIDCNQAAVEIYHFHSREETLDKSPMDVSALTQYDGISSAEKIQTYIQKVLADGSVVFEWKHQRPDGEFWDAEVHLIGFQSDDRKLLQVAMIDITHRKQAEEERRKLQNQLLQAQKMEAVGRLAGGVAHDFNNMLSVIIGRAELALMNLQPSDSIYKDLHAIKMVGNRSADLTRQLLAFARKQTIAPKIINLNDIIESMLKMLRQLIGEDVALLWKPAANLWVVKMDPTQIDQILANLVVNARDAIQDVGRVTIETANVVFDEAYCAGHTGYTPGQYVQLAVSDTGCGMDRETLASIFEPFFTTKPIGRGTGLGLATVYGIVKQNSGFIDVCSEPGKGTTFKIHQPRYVERAAQDPAEEEKKTEAARGLETILLVEDEPEILEVAQMMLAKLGYKLLTAATPGEAIRQAEEHAGEIHLLMTDVVMPEMNGRDLAKRLVGLYPDLKRLFMSGYTADVIAHHGVLEEGVHFIQKPFSINDLAAKVRVALD